MAFDCIVFSRGWWKSETNIPVIPTSSIGSLRKGITSAQARTPSWTCEVWLPVELYFYPKKTERPRQIKTADRCTLVVLPDSRTWIRARSSMNARRLASLLAASSEEIPASPPPPPPGCTALAGAAAAAAVTDDVALAGEGLGCYDETKRCQVRRTEKARKTSSI